MICWFIMRERKTYNVLIPNVRGNVTATALELSQRLSPVIWVGRIGVDILWNAVTGKEPHCDRIGVDLCGIDTTADIVEAIAVSFRVRRCD